MELETKRGWKECNLGPAYSNGTLNTYFFKDGEMLTLSLDTCPDEEILDSLFGKEIGGD